MRAKLFEERVGETRLLVGREGRFVLLSRVSPAETAVDGFEGQRLGLEESLVVLRAVERDSSDVEAMQVGRAEDLQLEVAWIVVALLCAHRADILLGKESLDAELLELQRSYQLPFAAVLLAVDANSARERVVVGHEVRDRLFKLKHLIGVRGSLCDGERGGIGEVPVAYFPVSNAHRFENAELEVARAL